MLGLATTTELRLALYGFVLAAIGGWLVYEHHHLIAEGESAVKAQDKTADLAQVQKDLATAKGTIDELQAKLAAVPQPKPAPVLRLCIPSGNVRALASATGAQPAVAGASGASPSGVPTGVAGLDIGQPMQDLKYAAQVSAIYRDTTWDWAVRQAK